MVVSAMPEQGAAVYSTVREEYRAATEGVGVADRSHLGRLKVNGEDAIDLLNRLSTNKLDDLQVDEIQGTALTTNKGRIIDLLYALRQDDHLLVITAPETGRRVAEWIDFYTFIEDVEVEDVSDETTMLSLLGADAARAFPQLAELPAYASTTVTIGDVGAIALRTDFIRGFACDIIVSARDRAALWDALTDAGAAPVGRSALELLRIERGMAGYGKELCEDYNPLEAGLIGFISFNKGCYIGQEVVARLNTYDKVQRRLVRLSLSDDAPELPSDLLLDGRKVGALTSAVPTLEGDAFIGLGYVRKAHAEPGVQLYTQDNSVLSVLPSP